MQLTVVHAADFGECHSNWSQYADSHNPFTNAAFLQLWFNSYSERRLKVALLADRDGSIAFGTVLERSQLAGIPFLGELKAASPSISPRLDIKINRDLEGHLAAHLNELMRQEQSVRLLFEHVPTESTLASELRKISRLGRHFVHESEGRSAPYVNVDRSVDEMYQSYSRSTRYWLRRSANRLRREGQLEISRYNKNNLTTMEFNAALEISNASWKGSIGTDMGGTAGSLALYRALSFDPPFDDFALWLLKHNGQPIAMQYHLIEAGTAYLLRSDFRQSHQQLSPGIALLRAVLEEYCADQSIKEFDLCGQAYEYKQKIASGFRHHRSFKLYRSGLVTRLARLFYACKGNLSDTTDQTRN